MRAGLDFGTTNSSLAVVHPDGVVQLARFRHSTGAVESFRSLLYLERLHEAGKVRIKSWSGPVGIEQYLQADEKGRLIQSLKSFLASRNLQSTEIFGRRFQVEELVAKILTDIRTQAEEELGIPIRDLVVGRPIRFVGSESDADDEYALGRLRTALSQAGFERVRFAYEPVGAAYHYESTLKRDELILIGDFGGGTSDFSLLRVGPTVRKRGRRPEDLLGNEGLGLAGDAFDARIVRHLVSPALGADTLINSGGKLLPVPNWVYFKLERWHHLSLLKSRETLNMLKSVLSQAVEPERIRGLLYLVQHDLGYELHRAVQSLKVRLSHAEEAPFHFVDGSVELNAMVSRASFEAWISEELEAIRRRVSALLQKTGVNAKDVDRVFLTGGSSFVPAVRRIFESQFGSEKMSAGDEFTSVARGLALSDVE
jgi:hypothetical chaperone protein